MGRAYKQHFWRIRTRHPLGRQSEGLTKRERFAHPCTVISGHLDIHGKVSAGEDACTRWASHRAPRQMSAVRQRLEDRTAFRQTSFVRANEILWQQPQSRTLSRAVGVSHA
jgi:hypothetical protein